MANAETSGDLYSRLPARPFPWAIWVSAGVVAFLLWWSAKDTGFSVGKVAEGWPEIAGYFGRLVPSSENPWPLDYLPVIGTQLLQTIRMALGGCIIGSALALPFALLGSRTLAPNAGAYNAARGVLNVVRAIPDLVLATLLAGLFAVGALPGLLALAIFTFGIVAKLLCDTIETVDPGPMEAVTAAGGSRLQRAVYAILPQVAPDFSAYTLYAFEVNVRAAAILGYVGAGGIGFILQENVSRRNDGHIALILFIIFLVVLVIDAFSTWLRGRLV